MKHIIIKYDRTAKILHWVSALVILWATISGLYIAFSNTEDHIKLHITELNISITTLFIPIFFFRILYRMISKVPPHSASISTVEMKMASLMHKFLYALVSTVLLSGVLMMDNPISIFNTFQFTPFLDNSNSVDFFNTLHKYATQLLAFCIFIHIVALIKHEVRGEKILRRML
jgi:cytochrome b561